MKKILSLIGITGIALSLCSCMDNTSGTTTEGTSVPTTQQVTTTKKTTTTVPTTTARTTTATTTEDDSSYTELEKAYRVYDSTYTDEDFHIDKISSLSGRDDFINGFDVSLVSHLMEEGIKYYNLEGEEESIYKILKDNNINTVRIRLFYDYTASDGTSCGKLDIENVTKMILDAKEEGLKVCLDFHYSDTWSDPSNQTVPEAWADYTYDEVKTAVYDYTKESLEYVKNKGGSVDYVQVGNEINCGIMWPFGAIDWDNSSDGLDNVAGLLSSGSKAVREVCPDAKIILHTANGLNSYSYNGSYGSEGVWFFEQMTERDVDFDICGSSFYTFYSETTPVDELSNNIDTIAEKTGKPVLLMEYSYPFTYKDNPYKSNYLYNDWEEPYEVSIQGQADLISAMISEVASAKNNMGLGTFYWGGEWVPCATDAVSSNWANQALFTYEGLALPSLRVYKEAFE